ncbi:MAG: OmpA family protein, partial [Pseudomonadota bacterium]
MWGVLPLGLLIAFAVSSKHQDIQNDLAARTEAKLQSVGLGWAGTAFDGRDGAISGQAFSPTQRREAADIVRSVWGVRVADNQTTLVELQKTYTWSAERDRAAVRLTGFV